MTLKSISPLKYMAMKKKKQRICLERKPVSLADDDFVLKNNFILFY
jgi:hypothetical protein